MREHWEYRTLNVYTLTNILLNLSFVFFTSFFFLFSRAFTTLCCSADGTCILAGGRSKNICIYNVQVCTLLKKYEITQNRSFDGVDVSIGVTQKVYVYSYFQLLII